MLSDQSTISIGNGVSLAVKITGNLSDPTILLSNGSILNYKQFDYKLLPQLQSFLDSDYSFVQYDYQGIGKSSDLNGGFDFVTLAEQQAKLLDELDIDQVHLFGISKGSIINQIMTSTHPETVISFAAYGSPNLANDEGNTLAKIDFQTRLDHTKSLKGVYDEVIEDNIFNLVYDTVYVPSIFDKQIFELGFLERRKSAWIKKRLKPMMKGTKVQILDKLFSYYIEEISPEEKERYIEAVKSIKCPVLLMHGTDDDTVPISSSELLHEWIEHSEFEKFRGFTHSEPLLRGKKAAKLMNRYAEFLDDINS